VTTWPPTWTSNKIYGALGYRPVVDTANLVVVT
jgi:hypothetical protein